MLTRIILAASLIAIPATALPQAVPPVWSNVLEQPNFKIDIDPKSIKLIIRQGGFEMLSRLKMDFGRPIQLPGKKPGAYYVNEVSAKCKDDTLIIEKSTLFTAEGEVVASGVDVAVIKNPKNPQSFITVWLHLACNQFKGKRPPTII